jgi:hypothetical protein
MWLPEKGDHLLNKVQPVAPTNRRFDVIFIFNP